MSVMGVPEHYDPWMLFLIGRVLQYEEYHPKGHFCLQDTLTGVPDEVKATARGYVLGVEWVY